jgi:hypothetical protein
MANNGGCGRGSVCVALSGEECHEWHDAKPPLAPISLALDQLHAFTNVLNGRGKAMSASQIGWWLIVL